VEIHWPEEFGRWLDDLEGKADGGDADAKQRLVLVSALLQHLADLPDSPTRDTESASLKWVRQSKRYPLWRVSHGYRDGYAVRLICWFPPDSDTVVVALIIGDKARIGDAFYNTVASRSDPLIDQWLRESERWKNEH